MGSGFACSSCVKAPKSRASSSRWRLNTTALTRGFAALAIGVVIMPTAMVGAAWALAASLQARSDIRSTVAYVPPADRLTWPGRTAAGMAGNWLTDPSDDTITAGSFAPAAYQLSSIDTTAIEITALNLAAVAPVEMTLDDAVAPPLPRSRPKLAALNPADGLPNLAPGADDGRTAVYDISARTVYLPNGERLEAHSGIGRMMDDPKFVHVRMRGATPPNTYTLNLRERSFHGVQAIRLTPVSEKEMFGRDGMLAHSYLLGPSGQSHGCVVFKDYGRFLRAFQRGDITHMIVVPRLPQAPNFANCARNAAL